MAIVLADVGAKVLLDIILNDDWPAGGKDLTLKLFATNVVPAHNSTAGSFTEAVGGGYASKTLYNNYSDGWVVSGSNDPRDGTYEQQTWTFTGPLTTNGTIYGYYVIDADGTLLWAEAFAQSFTPVNNGDALLLTPKLSLSYGTPA